MWRVDDQLVTFAIQRQARLDDNLSRLDDDVEPGNYSETMETAIVQFEFPRTYCCWSSKSSGVINLPWKKFGRLKDGEPLIGFR